MARRIAKKKKELNTDPNDMVIAGEKIELPQINIPASALAKHQNVGQTSGLVISQFLYNLFVGNERLAYLYQKGLSTHLPMTEEDISETVLKEFPHLTNAQLKLSLRRTKYNRKELIRKFPVQVVSFVYRPGDGAPYVGRSHVMRVMTLQEQVETVCRYKIRDPRFMEYIKAPRVGEWIIRKGIEKSEA